MNKKSCLFVAFIISIFLVIGLAVGGYFGYTNWYIPKMAEEYINETEDDYKETESLFLKTSASVDQIFGDADGCSINYVLVVRQKDTIQQAYQSVTSLLETAKKGQNNLPENNIAASAESKKLKKYYKDMIAFAERYQGVLYLYNQAIPAMTKIQTTMSAISDIDSSADSVAAIKKTANTYRTYTQELIDSRKSIEAISAADDADLTQRMMVNQLKIVETFMQSAVTAFDNLTVAAEKNSSTLANKALSDIKTAKTKMETDYEASIKEGGVNDIALKGVFQGIITKLKSNAKSVDDGFDKLKSKY